MKRIVELAPLSALGLLWLLSGCSSSGLSGSKPTDEELMGRKGATPVYIRPFRGGTNKPSYEVLGKRYRVLDTSKGYNEVGSASWYGDKFHGKPTSTGERYDMYEFTAAHKTLPLPTFVRVTNLSNNRSVVVKVNDRGPFVAGRIIDLSYAAATKLGTRNQGIAKVRVQALSPFQYRTQALADRAGVKPGKGGVGTPLADVPLTVPEPRTGSGGYEMAEVITFDDTTPSAAPASTVALAPMSVSAMSEVAPPLVRPASAPVQPSAPAALETPVATRPQTIMVAEPGQPVRTQAQASGRCQAGHKRCLQIGVFSDGQRADVVQQTIRQAVNGRVEVQAFSKNGQTFYRVLVGPMQPSQFDAMAQAIHKAGVYGRFINY